MNIKLCPYCESEKTISKGYRSNKNKRYCKNCGKYYQVDVEEESKIDFDENNNTSKEDVKDKMENDNEFSTTSCSKNKPRTIEDHVKDYGIDTDIFYVTRIVTNDWGVTNSSGEYFINYQTKIFWARDDVVFNYENIKAEIKDFASKYVPNYKKINYKFNKDEKNNLLELNINDLHLNSLCNKYESEDDYNVKIAEKRFFQILEKAVLRGQAFGFSRIVFPVGSDFFNTDNLHQTTTKGTKKAVEVRWQDEYKIGRELIIKGIDFLKQHAPVDVVIIPGNHDFERMFYLGDTLELWYSKCHDVSVNNMPKPRKYYQFGNVLIGYTHGNSEKTTDLPLIMAQECPVMWSTTKFREFHIGHLHHKKDLKYLTTKEYKGVVVRNLRSPAGTDDWHFRKGFIGSLKAGDSFIWNKEDGPTAIFEIVVK